MRRVVITGMGCVTPIGIGINVFTRSLFEGKQDFLPVEGRAHGEISFHYIAQVKDFDARSLLSAEQILLSERSSQFVLVAAREAIAQSGLLESIDRNKMAVVFGCSAGGRTAEEPALEKLYVEKKRVHPLIVPRSMASLGTSLVSIEYGITGPCYTVSTACASSTHAIGQAFHMVRSGMVDGAITGGHEAPLTYGFLKAWDSLRVVSPTVCRPFSIDRDGITLGEGAGVLILENLEHAQARGAIILGEIVGFGMSSDAQHMTQPKSEGAAGAMRLALYDSGSTEKDVCYINAHGTGTLLNDAMEAEAIRMIFGNATMQVPVSSTKSMHGHAMGASGAMEAIATVLALRQGHLPATAGNIHVQENLAIDVITRESRTCWPGIALSNSFAFGGLNAVVAFRTFQV
ncbi:MAG: beta-ketoacyl-[acyl-carrier-protein] synthase family protein [Acidobacteria bacterium]|nr:beta-ketoacyl-[acyl-carrier-protein] synthase family protein [Acidobacteriota bacterium]